MKKRIFTIMLVSMMLALTACVNTSTTDEASNDISTEVESTEIVEQEIETTSTEVVDSTEEIEPATETEAETPEENIPEPIEEPQAVYTYTDMSATMYAQQSVNVRDLPSTDGNKLGALALNQTVTVTGQCNETGWYRIDYNGSAAYVSNNYLGDSKVEVQQPVQQEQPAQSASEGDNGGNVTVPEGSNEELPSNSYTLDTLVEDTGSSVSFYVLTKPGYHAVPYEMVSAAHTYIGEDKHITSVDFIYSYGPFKEGFVWKYTVYYE